MMKKIICALLAVFTITSTAYADVEQVQNSNLFNVSGITDDKNSDISIQVFACGKDASDLQTLDRKDYLNVLVFHDQISSDESGAYSFKFKVPADISREYRIIMASEEKYLDEEKFTYVNYDEFTSTIAKINTLSDNPTDANINQAKELIQNHLLVFGINKEQENKIDFSDFAKVVLFSAKENKIDSQSRENARKLIDRMLFVSKLNKGEIANILAADDELSGISESEISVFLKSGFVTEGFKKYVTQRLSENEYSSISEYEKDLTKQFIFSVIKHPNGLNNLIEVLKYFKNEINLDEKSLTTDKASKLAGNDYYEYSEISEVLIGGGGNFAENGVSSRNPGINDTIIPAAQNNPNVVIDSVKFTDIESCPWAKEAIYYLAEKHIINGVGNNLFLPDNNIMREEFCKIIVEAFAGVIDNANSVFTDVDINQWYAKYINSAYALEIVNGISEKEFGVGLPILRQDLCVMIYNAIKDEGLLPKADYSERFKDDGSIADYAKEAIYSLKAFGAVNGADGSFLPENNATRAEASKIVYMVLMGRK